MHDHLLEYMSAKLNKQSRPRSMAQELCFAQHISGSIDTQKHAAQAVLKRALCWRFIAYRDNLQGSKPMGLTTSFAL